MKLHKKVRHNRPSGNMGRGKRKRNGKGTEGILMEKSIVGKKGKEQEKSKRRNSTGNKRRTAVQNGRKEKQKNHRD